MNEDWSGHLRGPASEEWHNAYYTGPIDGVIGPKTVEAMQRMGVAMGHMSDVTAELAARIQLIGAGIGTMSDELYGMILDSEDDGKDHPFPVSPDDSMTDAEYYWHRMLEDAKNEQEDPPF